MLSTRFRVSLCLALVLTALISSGLFFVPTAAAAEPAGKLAALARVMAIQDRNTDRMMDLKGVVGTATGLNAAGRPVIKVFTAKAGVRGIPAKLGDVPVVVEVTGYIFALPKPPSPPGRNTAPEVSIELPADLAVFDTDFVISFLGTATDKEDGELSGDLTWTSSIDADIGSGGSFSSSLSDGTHTITASVTDSGGKTGSDSITILVGGTTPPPPDPEKPPLWCDRPVPIGVSTGHPDITAGTIGCRVKDGVGNFYALSNNHVYANENRASIGDNVLQPGPYDGGIDPVDAIGILVDFEPIVFKRRANNVMDAAIALSSTEKLGNATPADGYGKPNISTMVAAIDMPVQKYGRTTGWTHGIVTGINGTFLVRYSRGSARFVHQIVVESVDETVFSDGGDSGSLVVEGGDNELCPVGLLFAGNSIITLCNPINAVLDRFDVTVDGTPVE